jgi:hypothetical protein
MSPSHDYKKQVVLEYARKYNCRTLVETGTYLGEMVEAMIPHFDRIISIELGEDLYRNAVRKFADARNVTLLNGDSGVLMPEVVRTLEGNVIFWLDAHYSGGITVKGMEYTPVIEETDVIKRWWITDQYYQDRTVLLVDDARLFSIDGWPSLDFLIWKYTIENDIIRIVL